MSEEVFYPQDFGKRTRFPISSTEHEMVLFLMTQRIPSKRAKKAIVCLLNLLEARCSSFGKEKHCFYIRKSLDVPIKECAFFV